MARWWRSLVMLAGSVAIAAPVQLHFDCSSPADLQLTPSSAFAKAGGGGNGNAGGNGNGGGNPGNGNSGRGGSGSSNGAGGRSAESVSSSGANAAPGRAGEARGFSVRAASKAGVVRPRERTPEADPR